MKLQKLLIICALTAIMMAFLVIGINAEIIQVGDNNIESITVTEGNSRADYIHYMFDGDLVTGGVYNDRVNVWFGDVGDTLTVTFNEELDVLLVAVYITGNWCEANVNTYDAQGNMTSSGKVVGENNHSGIDGEYRSSYNDADSDKNPDEETAIKVKKIELVIESFKWSQPRTLQISEIFMLANHEHNYNTFDTLFQAPTCALPGAASYKCSCGATENKPVDATGNHSETEAIVFRNGFANPGYKATVCQTCDTQDRVIQNIGPLFNTLGYSACTFGKHGIQLGIEINHDNIAVYNELAEEPLQFGIVAAFQNAMPQDSTDPILNGEAGLEAVSSKVIKKDLTNTSYTLINYKVAGFSSSYDDAQIILSLYLYDGNNIYYLAEDTTYSVMTKSYNDIAG